MSENRKVRGTTGRREFLGASVAGLAAGIAACNGARDAASRQGKFDITLLVEGGLFRLNKSNGNVELVYPRAMGDADCNFPPHSMLLEVEKGTHTVDGALTADWPWDLVDYTVTFAVGASTRKPDGGRWRKTPPKPAPTPGNAKEASELDWIPTIEGKPNDWDTRVATKLVFPTGDWLAKRTKDAEVRNELWSLKDGAQEVRRQYVTDCAEWADEGEGSVVLTFEKGGRKIGTITFVPESGGDIALYLTTPPMGGLVEVGKPVEHYCMYHSLLKDVEHKFVPYRLGVRSFNTKALRDGDPVPGRFCPGGKIIA